MRALWIVLPIGFALQGAWAQTTKAQTASQTTRPKPAPATKSTSTPAVMTDDERTVYALGLSIYRSLAQFDLSPGELAVVEKAMSDAAAGKPQVELNVCGPKIQPFARDRAARSLDKQKAASQAYLDKAAAQPGAVKTESGLVYRELRPGAGPSPAATDTV